MMRRWAVDRVTRRGRLVGLAAVFAMAWTGAGRADVAGLDAIADFRHYAILRPHTEAHYLSSYDRTGGNDDGFRGTYSSLYEDSNGEHVIFDSRGPGTVYTMWFTSRVSGWSPLAWGRLRFYFDDEPEPRLDVDANEFFAGRVRPFAEPFVFGPFQSTGGHVSYVPLPFARRLKITTERLAGFYNIYYHTYASDQDVVTWSGHDDVDGIRSLWHRAGRDAVASDESAVVTEGTVQLPAMATSDDAPAKPVVVPIFDITGEGAIVALRINPLFPLTSYQLRHIGLRMYWDEESEPSVEVPLGHFFGSGLGEAAVGAAPLGMSPSGAYYCVLPMPFWTAARIELVNENPEPIPGLWWQVRVQTNAGFASDQSGYFKARYEQEWPTVPGRDYRLLETEGRGVYVGQMMTVEPVRPETKRWWEGDLRMNVNGRRHPMLQGTGHEDEYLGGWSNEWLMNPYSLPMHGEPMTADLRQVDFQWSAATTAYRFFPSGIPFEAGLSVRTEHGTENNATASYSSVAYYYHRPSRMRRIGELDVGERTSERSHDYASRSPAEPVTLESRFEGATDATAVVDTGRAVSQESTFRFDDIPAHEGLRLRRLYDQREAQDAEVWIDGRLAGRWYTATTNVDRRWAESDFLLPATLTRGKTALEIAIRVRGAWNEYRYELWSIE